jgi:hypothetical protein
MFTSYECINLEIRFMALSLIAGDRQEARRHASVLVLAELVRHADVIVYPYVGSILDHIWVAFRDPNVRATLTFGVATMNTSTINCGLLNSFLYSPAKYPDSSCRRPECCFGHCLRP